MLTLLSRRMFFALADALPVVKMISPTILLLLLLSAKTNQIGTISELPSFLVVASFPVKVPCMRNLRTSAFDISVTITSPASFLGGDKSITSIYSVLMSVMSFCFIFIRLFLPFHTIHMTMYLIKKRLLLYYNRPL